MIEQPFEHDELDGLLLQAMAKRPLPEIKIDIAHVAMQKARTSPTDAAMVMALRVNRWNRIVTTIAVIAIVVVSAWIFHSHLAAGGFQSWYTTTVSDSTSTTTTTTTDISTTMTELMLAAGALALGAVVVVLCQRAIASGDEWIPAEFKMTAG
jgi:hypothetical protein